MKKGSTFDEDGELIEVNKVQTALASVGVSLLDAHDQFRDFDDVIFELADKWDTLDKNSQRYVATIAAGNRQQSRFIALVSNAQRLHKVADLAANSEDAGLIQYSKTLDSLESKQANLKTSFQQFYMDIFNGDFFKGIITKITTLLDGLNKLGNVTKISTLINLVKSLKAVLNISSNNLFDLGEPLITAYRKAYQQILHEGRNFGRQLPGAIQAGQQSAPAAANPQQIVGGASNLAKAGAWAGTMKGQLALNSISMVANGIGLSLAGNGHAVAGSIGTGIGNMASMAATGAILGSAIPGIGTALGTGLGLVIGALESLPGLFTALGNRLQEAIDNAKKEAEEKNIDRAEKQTKYKDLKSTIENLESLREKMNLSEEDYQAYIDASNAAVESYPELFGYLDSEGNSIVDLSDKYVLLAQAKEAAGKAGMESAQANLELSQAEYNKAVEDYKENMANTASGFTMLASNTANDNDYLRIQPNLTDAQRGNIAAARYAQWNDIENIDAYNRLAGVIFSASDERTYAATRGIDQGQNTAIFEAIQQFVADKEILFGQEAADFIEQNIDLLSNIIDIDLLAKRMSGNKYETYADWKAARSTAEVESAQRSIELDQKALIGSKVYSRTLGLDDDTALVAIDAANSIMQQALLSAFKASDYTDVDKWLTEDKSNYQETWNKVYDALTNCYNTLNESGVDAFNNILDNMSKYGETQFKNILTEKLGIDGNSDLYTLLTDYYTETYKTTTERFNKGIQDLNAAANFKERKWGYVFSAGEIKDKTGNVLREAYDLHNAGPAYYDDMLAQAQHIEQLFSGGKLNSDQAYAAWTQYAQMINQIIQITNPDERIKWLNRAIKETDWTSATEVLKLQDELQDSSNQQAQAAAKQLEGYDANMAINLVTEWNNLTEAISTQAEKYTEAIQNATSGMELDKALEMVKKVGGTLNDFQFIDGKWYYTNAEKLKEVYQQENEQARERIENYTNKQIAQVDEFAKKGGIYSGLIKTDTEENFKNFLNDYNQTKADALNTYNNIYNQDKPKTEWKFVDENDTDFLNWYQERMKAVDYINTYYTESGYKDWLASGETGSRIDYIKAQMREQGQNAEAISEEMFAYWEQYAEASADVQAAFGEIISSGAKAQSLKSFATEGAFSSVEKISDLFKTVGITEGDDLLEQFANRADAFGNVNLTTADFVQLLKQSGLDVSVQRLLIGLFKNSVQAQVDSLLSATDNLSETAATKTLTLNDIQSAYGEEVYLKLTGLQRTILKNQLSGITEYSDKQLREIGQSLGIKTEQELQKFVRSIKDTANKRAAAILSAQAEVLSGEMTEADIAKLEAGKYKNSVQAFHTKIVEDIWAAIDELLKASYDELKKEVVTYSEAKSAATAAYARKFELNTAVEQYGEAFGTMAQEWTSDQLGDMDSAFDKLTSVDGLDTSDLSDALASVYLTFGSGVGKALEQAATIGADGKYFVDFSKIIGIEGTAQGDWIKKAQDAQKQAVQIATEGYVDSISSTVEKIAKGEKLSVSDAQKLLKELGLDSLNSNLIDTLLSGNLDNIQTQLKAALSDLTSVGTLDVEIFKNKAHEIQTTILDAIIESLSNIATQIGEGISGELSATDFQSLLTQGIVTGIGAKTTATGVQLGGLDKLYAISQLYTRASAKGMREGMGTVLLEQLQDVDSSLTSLDQLDALITKLSNPDTAQTYFSTIGLEADESTDAVKQLIAALYDLRSVLMTDADSALFDFMNQDAFADRPQEHWEQLVSNIGSLKSALQGFTSSKEMDATDFYNIIDQIERMGQSEAFLASIGVETFEDSGLAIRDWADRVVAASDEIGKVNVSGFAEVGVDISAAATGMAESMSDGLKDVAQQQIDYLTGIEQMLLAFQALEGLGDIELGLSINIRDDNGDVIGSKTIETFQKLIEYWNSAPDNSVKESILLSVKASWDTNKGLQAVAGKINDFGALFGYNGDDFLTGVFGSPKGWNQTDITKFFTASDFFTRVLALSSDGIQGMLDMLASDMAAQGYEYKLDANGKYIFDDVDTQKYFQELFGSPEKLENLLNQTANYEQWSDMITKAGGRKTFSISVDEEAKLNYQVEVTAGSLTVTKGGEPVTVDELGENERKQIEDQLNAIYSNSLAANQTYVVQLDGEQIKYVVQTKREKMIADLQGGQELNIALPAGASVALTENGKNLKLEFTEGASEAIREQAKQAVAAELGESIQVNEETGVITTLQVDSAEVSLAAIRESLNSISTILAEGIKITVDDADAISKIAELQAAIDALKESAGSVVIGGGTENGTDGATANINFSEEGAGKVSKAAENISEKVGSIPEAITTTFKAVDINVSTIVSKLAKLIASITGNHKITFTSSTSGSTTGSKPGANNTIKLPQFSGNVRLTGSALVNGQMYGAAVAGKTLVGELGPELAVYDNQYHLLGEKGAEFVNLPSDAIVFNHLQTQGIIDGKVDSIRGTQLNSAYSHAGTAFAAGNVGPAMVGGGISSALAAVQRAKAIWQNMFNSLSAADLLGGGGGGGGGGGKAASLKPYIGDLQEWYNLSRQIVDLEKRINVLVAQRNNLSKGFDQGETYLRNLKESQALLEDQLNTQRDLYRYQVDELERQAKAINDSTNWISKFYKVGADGVLQYVEGNETNGGKGALEVLQELNDMGDNPERYTIKDQIDWINKVTNGQFERGFTWEAEQDDQGNITGAYEKKYWTDEEYVQEFFSALQEPIDDYDALRDTVQETETKFEELREEIEKINDEIRDNEIEVAQSIHNAIIDVREKAIDDLEESNKLIQEANQKYANAINDAISREREQYNQNQSIAERETLQRQLSLLRRSGGSASEIQNLEKTISDKLKDEYFTNQENSLEAIRDANDKQTELMNQQVQIMKDSLEYEKENGVIWTKAYEIMAEGNAFMLDFLSGAGADSFLEKSNLEQEKMLEEWAFKIGLYGENERSDYLQNKYTDAAFTELKNSNWEAGYKDIYNSMDAATRSDWDEDFLKTYNSYLLNHINGQSTAAEIEAAKTAANEKASQTFFEHIRQEKKRRDDNAKAAEEAKNNQSGGSGSGSGSGSLKKSSSSSTTYTWKNTITGDTGTASSKEAAEAALDKSYSKVYVGAGANAESGRKYLEAKKKANKAAIKKSTVKTKYATGGYNTTTGLAWLDGTPEAPEYILNAAQTAGLEQLVKFTMRNPDFVDVLKAHYDLLAGNIASQSYNTSNAQSIQIAEGAIQVNVAKLNDAYDINDISNDIMDRMYAIAAKSSSRSVKRR